MGSCLTVPPAMASYRMPDESEPHEATWMVFKASKGVWGADLAPYVEKDALKRPLEGPLECLGLLYRSYYSLNS